MIGPARREQEPGAPIDEWEPHELAAALQAEAPPHVLDVRTEGEFAQGSLPGALNIPLDELDRRESEIPRDGRLVVVCSDGERSAAAVMILRSLGITHATLLRGGLGSLGIVTDPDVEGDGV